MLYVLLLHQILYRVNPKILTVKYSNRDEAKRHMVIRCANFMVSKLFDFNFRQIQDVLG